MITTGCFLGNENQAFIEFEKEEKNASDEKSDTSSVSSRRSAMEICKAVTDAATFASYGSNESERYT